MRCKPYWKFNQTRSEYCDSIFDKLEKGNKMIELTTTQKTKKVLIADSTQMDDFLQCETLWRYKDLDRLQMGQLSEPLILGTFAHKMMEIYYKHRAMNYSIKESLSAALDLNPPQEIIPLSEDTRMKVKERFRIYVANFSQTSDIVPLSEKHVEVGFSEIIYEDCEHIFILEGKIDLFGRLAGLNIVMDHKWQMRKKALYKKAIQFRNYAMIGKVGTLIINYVRMAQKVDQETFQREIVSFMAAEHEWWKGEVIKIFHRMLKARLSGIYDQNRASCSGKYGYPCSYTEICEHIDPYVIEAKKKLYHIAPKWLPWGMTELE